VDVPNASLMVIEHAERFGLSQLHQLRGRVGRGAAASACVLLYSTGDAPRLGETAQGAAAAMAETNDGFEIARRDLEIRGPGEFLGARQSGAALLRFADLATDADLLEWARRWRHAAGPHPALAQPTWRAGWGENRTICSDDAARPHADAAAGYAMTLTELKYIVAVAREKHFGKAAEACFVSQPTLSVASRSWKKSWMSSCLSAAPARSRVTPLGEEIVRQAQSVLEQAAHQGHCQARQGPAGRPAALGVIYTIGPYLLPELVRNVIRLSPQMPLMLQENFTVKLLEMLRTGEIDCAILAEPFPDAGLAIAPLYDEPFMAACPAPPAGGAEVRHLGRAQERDHAAAGHRPLFSRPCAGGLPRVRPLCQQCRGHSQAVSRARRWRPSSTWWPPAWA
jgi:DNA-binding transcriptional LysR family regulator